MGYYQTILESKLEGKKGLAILIDPDKFDNDLATSFLKQIPKETTHLFVGGSSVANGETERTVEAIKKNSSLPVLLFPGDHSQRTPKADAVLFLSLLSGRNSEYLVGQQVRSVSLLRQTDLEIIPTAYLLLDGGNESAVARISETSPMSQEEEEEIVKTALAGQYMGAKLVYLEAGSGAKFPVKTTIIEAVKNAIEIPLVVGGGIKSQIQKLDAYTAGADMVVMGTVFEPKTK